MESFKLKYLTFVKLKSVNHIGFTLMLVLEIKCIILNYNWVY